MASLSDPSAARRRGQPVPAAVAGAPVAASLSHPVMLVLFLLTMTQPYLFKIGPVVMGPYRLVLVILAIPLLLNWVRGKYGGFVAADFLLLGHILWIAVSLAANGQSGRIFEFTSSQFFEIFIAYLLGRAAIRNREDFYFFTKVFLGVLLFLLPFAILESTQGLMLLQDTFRNLPGIKTFDSITVKYPPRMGMRRAMTTLNHPIIFGVTCSMAFSLAIVGLRYAAGGTSLISRLFWSAGSAGGTFFSLSAGALTGLALQLALIGWDTLLKGYRNRWKLLGAISVIIYIFLDIVAVRPPLVVLARYVAFSSSTSWNRYMIWQYGTAEVGRNPIFGMGLFTDWVRSPWMPPSVDNHWLLQAMRWGLTGCALLLGMYFYILVRLIRVDLKHDPEAAAIRKAMAFIFIGLFFQMGTVLVWQFTQSLLFVMLGGSVWLFNETDKIAPHPGAGGRTAPAPPGRRPEAVTPSSPEPVGGKPAIAYTRFPADRRPDRAGSD